MTFGCLNRFLTRPSMLDSMTTKQQLQRQGSLMIWTYTLYLTLMVRYQASMMFARMFQSVNRFVLGTWEEVHTEEYESLDAEDEDIPIEQDVPPPSSTKKEKGKGRA